MDNSILDTIKEAIGNFFSALVDFFKKYKKYVFILMVICILVFGAIKLLQYFNDRKGKMYLVDKIKQELNCKETNICVYTNNTNSNNYVWYSGFLWRIVKINDDGSIKLVLNESVGVVNHYNGLNNDYLESFIRLWLNEGVFLKGLNNPNNFIKNYDFCYGDELSECSNVISDKIGLLTYSDYQNAGGKDSYLNIGLPFWTMTSKKDTDTDVYIVDENGELVSANTGLYYQIRPVINLNSNVMIYTRGEGTLGNPYSLIGDEPIDSNEYLNTRYTGEFVKFAGKVWRITETSENYTKLVLYGKDTKMKFGNNNVYSNVENTVNSFLGNVYYNILKGALPDIDMYLTASVFYGGKLSNGDAYTNTRISTDEYYDVSSSIGILALGELFSGNDLNLSDDDITWTITPNGSNSNELWLSNGKSTSFDTEYAVRPVIYLQGEVYIIGGSGDGRSRETAYEISVEQ